MRLVCGVGYNDRKYPTRINGIRTKQYAVWRNMIERCHSAGYSLRNETYKDSYVSDNFKSFSYFYEWCQKQIGFKNNGWHLDKDILIKGNKVYSEDVCVFVPGEINKLLTKSDASRGDCLIGVSFDRSKGLFESHLRVNGKLRFLGYFSDEISAHKKYKEEKEAHVKNIATKWAGLIDHRAYDALMEYKVEITD